MHVGMCARAPWELGALGFAWLRVLMWPWGVARLGRGGMVTCGLARAGTSRPNTTKKHVLQVGAGPHLVARGPRRRCIVVLVGPGALVIVSPPSPSVAVGAT